VSGSDQEPTVPPAEQADEQMRDATELLRDQAWVISALTRQISEADDADPVADDETTVTKDGIP
jgi:hypothetical protein